MLVTREAALAYGLAGLLRSLPFHNSRHKLYLPLDLLAALDMTPEEFFHLEKTIRAWPPPMRQVALRARDHFLAARAGAQAARRAGGDPAGGAGAGLSAQRLDARRADPPAADGAAQSRR